jgi:nitrous oxide reductase accessory protein NosL
VIRLTALVKELASSSGQGDDADYTHPSRHLWWQLAELDAQLSFLFGRKPCMVSSAVVPRPNFPIEMQEYKKGTIDFTDSMVDLLNSIQQAAIDRRPGIGEEKRAVLQSCLTRLQDLQSRLPSLPQSGLAESMLSCYAQQQVDIQSAMMVIYCQLLRSKMADNTKAGRLRNQRDPATKGFYKRFLECLRTIIDIFDYSYKLDSISTASSWPRCFGVYCAALMLGIARLRQETDVETDNDRLRTAIDIFAALAETGQASGVAALAADSLQDILDAIGELEQAFASNTAEMPVPGEQDTSHHVAEKAAETSGPQTSRHGLPLQASVPSVKRTNASSLDEETRGAKRAKIETETTNYNHTSTSSWEGGQYPQAMSYDQSTNPPLQTPPMSQPFEQQPYSSSTAVSFSEPFEFYEGGYVASHAGLDEYHPGNHWLHPPLVYFPPLYDSVFQAQFQSIEDVNDPGAQQMFFPSQGGVEQSQVINNTIHGTQHTGYHQMQQTSPPHPQDMMMTVAQEGQTVAGPPALTLPHAGHQQAQIYSARSGPPAQSMSSPEDAPSQMRAMFAASSEPNRRRSVADIRNQEMSSWAIETQRPNEHHQQDRRTSLPFVGVPSPNSDPGLSHQGDVSQSQANDEFAALSSQSSTHLHGSMIRIPHDNVQHSRQDLQQPGPSQYELKRATPYNMTMTDDVLDYGQQMQYHHHLPAAAVAVTTGPFHGQAWGWSR